MRRRVMSSLLGRTVAATLPGLLMVVSLTTACAAKSPTEPGSAGKTPSPSISIVSLSVASETLVSGAHVYRVIVKLRESGGAAATIGAIDLSFSNGSSAVVSSHVERPISDAANVVAPNSTIDSRELMTIDDDPSHAHATTVSAKVTYTDGGSMTSSATASSDVPLSVAPTFTLSGIVSEENTAGRAVAGGTVQVVDGPNAGKSSSTDGNGSYTLTNLAAGSFSTRASAHGYNPTERSVTVAQDTRLDLRLLRTPVSPAPGPLPSPAPGPPPSPVPGPPPSPVACTYTAAPSTTGTDYKGGTLTATISRTAGNCSWQATSSVSWITFTGGASGNGSASLAYVVGANPGFNTRIGSITISWTGGSAQIQVQQGNNPDWYCFFSVTKGPQDFNNVPSAGGQLTVTVFTYGVPPTSSSQCSVSTNSNVPWISGGGTTVSPGGTLTLTVAPNSTGAVRNGSIVATGSPAPAGTGSPQTIAVTQR
jgi:hypothetical protein